MALSRQEPSWTAGEHDLFLLTLGDDTGDAPWMVLGDWQLDAAISFRHCLRAHARAHQLQWFVASMLPIRYLVGQPPERHQLSPDCFVAFVPSHRRASYDLEVERLFPSFVLEVVSPFSEVRDTKDKVRAYDILGAREYALFTPPERGPARLAGYRRDAEQRMVPWYAEADGSLWSEVLKLRLVIDGEVLLAETGLGERLLSPDQEVGARQEAERARREMARALRAETSARQRAEAEVARLQDELDRLRKLR